MKALVVGATTGLGRALCEELCSRGYDLLISSSDEMDLSVFSKHLILLYGVNVDYIRLDTSRLDIFLHKLAPFNDELDCLFFPIGVSNEEDIGELIFEEIDQLVTTNMISVITIVSFYLRKITSRKKVTIIGFGSIATIRARSFNMVYSAAKKGLEYYFYSLKHKLSRTNIRVHFYNLGYVKSQLSYGKTLLIKPCPPEKVARAIIERIDSRSDIFMFYPRFWAIIAIILRIMPWFIFKRFKV